VTIEYVAVDIALDLTNLARSCRLGMRLWLTVRSWPSLSRPRRQRLSRSWRSRRAIVN